MDRSYFLREFAIVFQKLNYICIIKLVIKLAGKCPGLPHVRYRWTVSSKHNLKLQITAISDVALLLNKQIACQYYILLAIK